MAAPDMGPYALKKEDGRQDPWLSDAQGQANLARCLPARHEPLTGERTLWQHACYSLDESHQPKSDEARLFRQERLLVGFRLSPIPLASD